VAVIALIAVGFNGWLGSQVVSSNLKPVVISLHMAGAFFVQMALIYATTRASRAGFVAEVRGVLPTWFRNLLLFTMGALIVQIILGLQIRESIDWISRSMTGAERDQWIALVPQIFYVHRSFSWVILGLACLLVWKIFKSRLRRTLLGRSAMVLVGLIVFEMLLGGALNHLDFPAVAQPLHLLAAHLIFGVLWFQWCVLSVSRDPAGTVFSSPTTNRNSYV
jgi:cytochrome c oxidase assembly protein subunit 15